MNAATAKASGGSISWEIALDYAFATGPSRVVKKR